MPSIMLEMGDTKIKTVLPQLSRSSLPSGGDTSCQCNVVSAIMQLCKGFSRT